MADNKIIKTWGELSEYYEKINDLSSYYGTAHDPAKYRSQGADICHAVMIFMIVSGVIAMFVTGAMGHKFLPVKLFTAGLLIGVLAGVLGYFMPLIELSRRERRLRKSCTVSVEARCTKSNEINYSQARSAQLISPYYPKPHEEESVKLGELYYDPEYIYIYDGKAYKVSERSFTRFGTFEGTQRTIYIDPEEPAVFYDPRRYGQELSEAKENCMGGLFSRLVFAAIAAGLAYLSWK